MIYTLAPFSVPVFVAQVKWKDKNILKEFSKLEESKTTAFIQRKNLEKNKDFDSLKSLIIKITHELIKELGVDVKSLEVVSMWANDYESKESIHPHTHPNSWLSGVYYPDGCESGPIKFINPLLSNTVIRPKTIKDTPFNKDLLELTFTEESMVVFPSWLMHYTVPATEPKTSIAFNIWPRGSLEIDDISKVIA